MKNLAIIIVVIITVMGCNQQPVDKIDRANAMLRSQVANDVTVDIDRSGEKLIEVPGEYFYVCGKGTVNQPGLVDHHVERFIVTVNTRTDGGLTIFDGNSDQEAKTNFQKSWDSKCGK